MKKILILSAAVAMILSSCGSNGGGSLKSDHDSLSYSIGVDLGNYVKNLDSTININILTAGINDVINGKEKLDHNGAIAFLQNYFTVVKPAKELEASNEYLKEIEALPNVQKTESGLLYEIIEQGDMEMAPISNGDQVSVVYEGSLRNGKVFDSSIERGDTVSFVLDRVIKGWSEGMKLIGKGGKIVLYIPSELGYGAQGPQGIGANQALKFEVELIDVAAAK